jgi:hypothetical protein
MHTGFQDSSCLDIVRNFTWGRNSVKVFMKTIFKQAGWGSLTLFLLPVWDENSVE